MAKLCYRIGNETKKYDLKDSVTSSPKLAVRYGNSTKYLKLKEGTKPGELHVAKNVVMGDGIVPSAFHVERWDVSDHVNWWTGLPDKGTVIDIEGDTECGGCAIWALQYEGRLAALIGMVAADRPEEAYRAEWNPIYGYMNNFIRNTDCGTPCIRLATIPFFLEPSNGVVNGNGYDYAGKYSYRAVPSNIYQYLTDTSLLQSQTVRRATLVGGKYYSFDVYCVGCGANYLDTIYANLPNSAKISSIRGGTNDSSHPEAFRIDCGNDSTIRMLGCRDGGNNVGIKWAVRCFLVEYPDVIQTGKTPRELLDIWKTVWTEQESDGFDTDYGTCYGRNWSTSYIQS